MVYLALRSVISNAQGISDVSWSPDSAQIATASDDTTVKLWDAKSSTLARTFTGHTNYVMCVNFNPKGNNVLS